MEEDDDDDEVVFLNSDHYNTLEELIFYTASLFQISVGLV
jgi:hypothetical protein